LAQVEEFALIVISSSKCYTAVNTIQYCLKLATIQEVAWNYGATFHSETWAAAGFSM